MVIQLHKSRYVFAHIDCDCFFVSVELIKKPWLRGKAVCVCGPTGNSGVVTSASYEARPFGIRAGTPVFKARQMCPHGLFIKGSFNKYGQISFQLFEILHRISPHVEHSSVDEGYIDLTNLNRVYQRTWDQLGRAIQTKIWHQLQVPISIGIAPTKTLAKLASDRDKPRGISIINDNNLEHVLRTSAIRDVCGFGRRLSAHIQVRLNVNNLWEFVQTDPTKIRRELGTPGLVIWCELQGTALRPLDTEARSKPPQSILRSSMFPHKTNDQLFIRDWLLCRLEEALKKLNRYQLNCQSLGIFLRQDHPYKVSQSTDLQEPTANAKTLIPIAKELFNSIYQQGTKYRAAGVWLRNFTPRHSEQLPLFPQVEKANLSELLNQINKETGLKRALTTGVHLQRQEKPEFNLPFLG